MASSTGVPERNLGEDEPLLGRVGDASQPEGRPLYYNLIIGMWSLILYKAACRANNLPGTAVIAQGGILLLAALVWAGVFLHQPLSLFSAHPLLNSSAILFLTESILILQPTHTAEQKRQGTRAHFGLNNLALDAMVAAFVIIEYNKFSHDAPHFDSIHGKLGLITYILLAIQALVGFTQYFVPKLYGNVDKAKSMYKWHRMSGYLILVMMLATVSAATQTYTGGVTLDIKLWAVLVSSVLILVGVLPRIKKQKFDLVPKPSGAFGQ
jgi:hypothetical protein